MAANLARAGFPVTAWNRTPGRAPELAELGVAIAATPADAVADADIVVDLRLGHARCRGGPVRPGRRRGRRSARARSSSTARRSRPSASWDFAARLPRARAGDGRRAGLGRQRGRPEGDADDLRRRRGGRRRARPAGPRGAWARRSPTSGRSAPGQAVKAVNQVILAGTYLGVAEGIVLAIKAGLDVEQVVGGARRAARRRAGSSPTAAAG